MGGKIKLEDMPPELIKQLGLGPPGDGKQPKMVKSSVIAIGGVLQALKGLTSREALWALRTATVLVRGYKKDKEAPLGKVRNAKQNKAWRGNK